MKNKITPGVIMVKYAAYALSIALLALIMVTGCPNATWHNDPKPLQSGVQPADPQRYGGSGPDSSVAILDGLPGCLAPGWQALAIECFEGGQPDGQG